LERWPRATAVLQSEQVGFLEEDEDEEEEFFQRRIFKSQFVAGRS